MNIKALLLTALLGSLFLASCSKEEVPEPIEETNDKVEFEYSYIDEATVAFTAAEGGKKISWDFGDGETANGKSVEHKFTESGEFDVKLSVEKEDKILEGAESVEIEISNEYMLTQNWSIIAAKKNGENQPGAIGARFGFRRDGSYSIGSIDGFFWRWNEDKSGVIVNSGTSYELTWYIQELNMDKLHVNFKSYEGDDWVYVLNPLH